MHKLIVCNDSCVPDESLDDMLCFSLYAASRTVTQAYRAALAPHDLTYPQFLVSVALHRFGEQSVSDLGATMQLDSGTLSPLLKRLESRGFIARERRSADERIVMISLTAAGQELRREVATSVECLSPAYGVSIDELSGLLDQLHRITAGMTGLTASLRAPGAR